MHLPTLHRDQAKKAGLEIQTLSDPDSFRKVAYEFDVDVLRAATLVTGLSFSRFFTILFKV
jgi:hypothetical protein